MKVKCLNVILGLTLTALAGSSAKVAESRPDAYRQNALIGKGINLGNALEARKEGEWLVRLEEEYFDLIAKAGFDSVRIPIRWSAHAEAESPYTIDPAFLSRVDWAVDQALSRSLVAIINVHHYKEFMESPAEHRGRLLGMWKQISEHYRNHPKQLYFEIMNEPCRNVTAEIWNEVQNEAVALIRKSNPDRAVLVSPIGWNRIDQLKHLELPSNDPNLIASVHYYEPHGFTHQGAGWVDAPRPVGIPWNGNKEERHAVVDDFERAAAWSDENRIPIHVGEFGAYSKADMDSRVRWTAFVREQAEEHGMSWNYWEFCSSFGVYDPMEKVWRKELLQSLLPR